MVVNKDKIHTYLDEGTLEYNMMFNYFYEVDVSLTKDRNTIMVMFPSLANQICRDFIESADLSTIMIVEQSLPILQNKISEFGAICISYMMAYFSERYGMEFDIRTFKEAIDPDADDETALNDFCKGVVRTIEICMKTDPGFKQILRTIGSSYMAFFSSIWKDINNIALACMDGMLTRMKIQTTKVGSVYYIPNMKDFMDDE